MNTPPINPKLFITMARTLTGVSLALNSSRFYAHVLAAKL